MRRHEGAAPPLGSDAGIEERNHRTGETCQDEPYGLIAPGGPGERIAPPQEEIEPEDGEGHEEEKNLAEEGTGHGLEMVS